MAGIRKKREKIELKFVALESEEGKKYRLQGKIHPKVEEGLRLLAKMYWDFVEREESKKIKTG